MTHGALRRRGAARRRRLPRLVLLLVTGASSVLATPLGASAPPAGASAPAVVAGPSDPVYGGDFPDPAILQVGTTYYAYATNTDGDDVPVMTSTDLVHWHLVGDAMAVLPPWAESGFTWSPSVAVAPSGGYELFFSAFDPAAGVECIGRATASAPTGPFVNTSGVPFFCEVAKGGSIDPSLSREGGHTYLVWKSDGEGGQAQAIWAAELDPANAAVVGEPTRLLVADQWWEDRIVEGPALVDLGGTTYLFFSAGRWDTAGYTIGATTCAGPLGPCDDAAVAPVLASSQAATGPGGPSFFTVDGTTCMAYAAWLDGIVGGFFGRRGLFLASVHLGSAAGSVPAVTFGTVPDPVATTASQHPAPPVTVRRSRPGPVRPETGRRGRRTVI